MFSTAGYFLGQALCRVLPRGFLYALAHSLADLCHLARRSRRQAVRENLRVVLGPEVPEAELRAMGRRVFRNFAERVVDFLRLAALAPEELRESFVIEGGEHLERARRDARGPVLFLTAHLGNWEWGAALMGLSGELQGVVARRHSARAVECLFRRSRGLFGLTVFEEQSSAPRVLGLLRSGASVAMLADRDVTRGGRSAEFFGRPARVPRGHVCLALRAGATILPGFVVCEANGRHRLIFEPPLVPEQLGSVERGVDVCLGVLEKYIRRYPEQWLVFEPVWTGAA